MPLLMNDRSPVPTQLARPGLRTIVAPFVASLEPVQPSGLLVGEPRLPSAP